MIPKSYAGPFQKHSPSADVLQSPHRNYLELFLTFIHPSPQPACGWATLYNKKQLWGRTGSGGKRRREKPRLPHQLPWIKRFIKVYIKTGTEEPEILRWRPPNASFLIGGWMVGQLCYVWSRPSWAGLALGHRTESQILWLKDLSVQSRFWKPEQTVGKGWGRYPRISYLNCVPQSPWASPSLSVESIPPTLVPNSPTVRPRVQVHVVCMLNLENIEVTSKTF